jgi:hypothetical protein
MINPLDEKRLKHINHLMDVDRDFNQAEQDINQLISTLNNIKSSFKDEI